MAILRQLRHYRATSVSAFMPIIRRRRQSPNVLRFLQIDSAVSRLLWIDVHDVGYCPFVCEKDLNPDFHAYAKGDGGQNQRTMEVDDKSFARLWQEAEVYS
jgi:hypothetical protein